MPDINDCPVIISLLADIAELQAASNPLVCSQFCPVVVGEVEGVDSPINLNPVNPTAITWGGWQSQDETIVETSGNDLLISSDDVCVAHVTASVTFVNDDTGANAQRTHPELWLLKDGQRVALAQTYIRDNSGQDSDTANISWYDMDPVAGSVYTLEVVQDSIGNAATGQATAPLEIYFDTEIANYMQVAAHRRFQLCATVSDGTGGDAGGFETGAPANGVLISDNFQDGNNNAPFNLQVRNQTNNATDWQACTPNVPYASIPNLVAGAYTLNTINNADGTYKHCFTGTSPLGAQGSANSSISITGGLPNPAGSGGAQNVELYIP